METYAHLVLARSLPVGRDVEHHYVHLEAVLCKLQRDTLAAHVINGAHAFYISRIFSIYRCKCVEILVCSFVMADSFEW